MFVLFSYGERYQTIIYCSANTHTALHIQCEGSIPSRLCRFLAFRKPPNQHFYGMYNLITELRWFWWKSGSICGTTRFVEQKSESCCHKRWKRPRFNGFLELFDLEPIVKTATILTKNYVVHLTLAVSVMDRTNRILKS